MAFANDASAAAFGEYWVGSGRDYNSMVMFTLGTGVGGGIILDGIPVHGENSFGAEFGHIVIDQTDTARSCVWGRRSGRVGGVCKRVGDCGTHGKSCWTRVGQAHYKNALLPATR